MSRFYIRLALIPTVLFTVVLILIHTQPYDDHELRELLLPEGCPAPCLMGIRPGVTTMDEAVAILQANPWVEHVEKESNVSGDIIKWTWNNQISKQIIPTSQGSLWAAQNSERPLVDTITISNFLQLGEVYVLLGRPDTETLVDAGYSIGETYAYIDYTAFYNNQKLFLTDEQACRTGYPGTGKGEAVGFPFTMPISIVIGGRFTSSFSGWPIPTRSPIHLRPACGS